MLRISAREVELLRRKDQEYETQEKVREEIYEKINDDIVISALFSEHTKILNNVEIGTNGRFNVEYEPKEKKFKIIVKLLSKAEQQ